MNDYDEAIEVLSEPEALELLASQHLGRLVERVGERVEIFPINYVVDGNRLIFRTAPGTKLAGIVAADEILIETDRVTTDEAWSVIARGHATILEREDELARAEQLDLRPLTPTVKRVFVAITVDSITGRRFHRGEEPEALPETIA